MGILDNIVGALTGGGQGGNDALVSAVTHLLGQESGGLGGLVQKFEQAGMGDLIKGWISTGPNPAINADQLRAALGSDVVQQLAQRAGVDANALLGGLAQQLPGLIDKLTPDGVAPDANALTGLLGQLLGGRS
ncbi:MAG: DUF937 domain-containing protein [Hyphomonadaceae bacterium]|nr:DUF937 domain-containing protein [Hyphomonadaceae bacterium]